jgi:hypothetical protein
MYGMILALLLSVLVYIAMILVIEGYKKRCTTNDYDKVFDFIHNTEEENKRKDLK